MRLELKPFQELAVEAMGRRAGAARAEAVTGEGQALVLSAPTGSGKTVIATAWMESIVRGDDMRPGDPDATFLWITDDRELNEQTRRKLLATSDLFDESSLVTIDSDSFDRPLLDPGAVYFLNIQKLSRTSNLVRRGDTRTHTLWETIAETARQHPSSLWIVIDEAHRGMRENGNGERARKEARTIVQRFIKGSEEIPPVPLVCGISATAQRFTELLGGTTRTQRAVTVEPDDVRTSGLLKDTITLFHTDEDQPSDLTLLAAAAKRLKDYSDEWRGEPGEDPRPTVHPLLVVQVEDGTKATLTKSDISAALEVIEKELGPLRPDEVAHAFQEGGTLLVGDLNGALHYVAPPDIESSPDLRVVFFKRSLTTGWDCPRAEVMMSFRTARDETLSAQLVGRMVRTPLARRVEGDEFLNSVSLYLPYYDEDSLNSVIERLSKPDPENGLPGSNIQRGNKLVTLKRDPVMHEAFDRAEGLPIYRVERVSKLPPVRCLVKLGMRLAIDELETGADDAFCTALVDALDAERAARVGNPDFEERVDEAAKIDVREVSVAVGERKLKSESTSQLAAEARNIEHAYAEAVRKLGDGEVGRAYLKRRAQQEQTDRIGRFKQELFALMQEEKVRKVIASAAESLVDEALDRHETAIDNLPEHARHHYRAIRRQGARERPERWEPPQEIEGSKEGESYDKHLFVKADGTFTAALNNLERRTLAEDLGRDDVVGWLRNESRKPWAFSLSYQRHGEAQGMYPDFLIFRRAGGHVVCDVLEPHSQSQSDSVAKAVGMAVFAERHSHDFGRIELIDEISQGGQKVLKRLPLKDPETQRRVKAVKTEEHLRQLFEDA